MKSFKCSKCSNNTVRNYDLTRHLKRVHGIYANTSFKGDNQQQAGLPNGMSEKSQYSRGESHRHRDMTDEEEEEEEEEPRINPEDGLYPPSQIGKFSDDDDDDMRRKKCRILDCVLDTFPDHLKTKAKSMCDILKCKDRLFILPSIRTRDSMAKLTEEATYEIILWIH